MVPNPNLKHGGWYDLAVQFPSGKGLEPTHDMYIGRFTDNKYHLLGYVKLNPNGANPDRHAERKLKSIQSGGDRGIVQLPEGKTSLTQLIGGDNFSFNFHGSDYHFSIKYVRRN
jgi:hypothetical protein